MNIILDLKLYTLFLDDIDYGSLNDFRLTFLLPFFTFFCTWLVAFGKHSSVPSSHGAVVSGAGCRALPARLPLRKPPEAKPCYSWVPRGTTGRASSLGAGAESTTCLRPFPMLLEDFHCGFSSTGSDDRGKGRPFSAPGLLRPDPYSVSILQGGAHRPPKGTFLIFHGEISSFFLPLLQIATKLRVRGRSPLMFILLFSTICVEGIHNHLPSLFRQF